MYNAINNARNAKNAVDQEKNNLKGAANYATNNKYAQGAKAGAAVIDNLTGGSDDYRKRLQKEAYASLPGFEEVNNTPIVGDITNFALDMGASLGHGFNKLFGIDDSPKERIVKGYGGKSYTVSKYKKGMEQAFKKAKKDGPGVYQTDIGKVLIWPNGTAQSEFIDGNKKFKINVKGYHIYIKHMKHKEKMKKQKEKNTKESRKVNTTSALISTQTDDGKIVRDIYNNISSMYPSKSKLKNKEYPIYAEIGRAGKGVSYNFRTRTFKKYLRNIKKITDKDTINRLARLYNKFAGQIEY